MFRRRKPGRPTPVPPQYMPIARYSAKGRSNEGNLVASTNDFRNLSVNAGSTYTYTENIEVPDEWIEYYCKQLDPNYAMPNN